MSKHPLDTYWIPLVMSLGIAIFFLGFAESLSFNYSIACWVLGIVLLVSAGSIAYRKHKQRQPTPSRGGTGGIGYSQGDLSEADGGNGGNANGGIGGNGGNAIAKGKGSRARGGAGGAG